jgi:signal transduction histidine kinase
MDGNVNMDMLVLDEQVARWEVELPQLSGLAQLQTMVALAWHLRQRNTQRALVLADAAVALMAQSTLTQHQQKPFVARLKLLRGKAKWLFAELDAAVIIGTDALQHMLQLDDAAGVADAHWLLSVICNDQGRAVERDRHWDAALLAAQRAHDPVRVGIVHTMMATWAAYRNPPAAVAKWGPLLEIDEARLHPALVAGFSDFWAVSAAQSGDFCRSIVLWTKAFHLSLTVGQVRCAITAAVNIGDNFNSLNDHHSALEWMPRGLDLARPTGWPLVVGGSLMQMGETLRRLGRLQAAHAFLTDALHTLTPVANSRNHAIALAYLCDLMLDQRDYGGALDTFNRLMEHANRLDHADFQTTAARGKAHALLELGRPDEAHSAALAALALAQAKNDGFYQIAALKVLADIHARHPMPAPEGMTACNAQLHYLHEAQNIAAGIECYTVTGDLLDAIADAHAASGDYDTAYALTCDANAARDKTHSQEATNRAIAMQVVHQTERAQAEGAYHRQLAIAETQRAETLQQTSATLEHLGAIGQEITAHLDAEAVFQALNSHVHGLLDICHLRIFLTDPDGLGLTSAFGIEAGRPLPSRHIPIAAENSYAARCLREHQEILTDAAPDSQEPTWIPGTLSTLSGLFAPLMIDDRVLGVMTIQSMQRYAYGAQERLIFRTLCAYGAIALDNANAYSQLQETQSKLVAHEKLAALGAMVAGVAHELNTPIGNSMLMTSALQEKTEALDMALYQHQLTQNDLAEYLTETQETADLILRGLTQAADLVSSFKQVAVDRTSEQRRVFNLQQTCHELIATMMNQIRLSGHNIELNMPPDIDMDSYPGPLGQVISNLINNALVHAFNAPQPERSGMMRLNARTAPANRVVIQFHDNGTGIAQQNLTRVFEPFFTTKTGQGDSGLGLSIIYNIVTSLLNGRIQVESTLGEGTTFTLDLPLAPEYC